MMDRKTDSQSSKISGVGVGIAIGIAIGSGVGAAVGVALHNIAIGVALGSGIGLAIGMAIGAGLGDGKKATASRRATSIAKARCSFIETSSYIWLRLGCRFCPAKTGMSNHPWN